MRPKRPQRTEDRGDLSNPRGKDWGVKNEGESSGSIRETCLQSIRFQNGGYKKENATKKGTGTRKFVYGSWALPVEVTEKSPRARKKRKTANPLASCLGWRMK